MPRKRARDIERTYSRSQFVAKLRRFADAIESAKPFTIQVGGERLHIPASARFNIEHEREGVEEELEFQLMWSSEPKEGAVAARPRSKAAKKK
jgi:amphi-Trp domain-containing protein